MTRREGVDLFELFKICRASGVDTYIRGKVLHAQHLIQVVNAIYYGSGKSLQVRNIVIPLGGPSVSNDLTEIAAKAPKAGRRIRKLASKIDKADRQHILFFSAPGTEAWWTISFTLRDLSEIGGEHYRYGSHVHHSSHVLQPILSREEIEARVASGDRSVIPRDKHISFNGYIGQDLRLGL